jgi:hypothetical protein
MTIGARPPRSPGIWMIALAVVVLVLVIALQWLLRWEPSMPEPALLAPEARIPVAGSPAPATADLATQQPPRVSEPVPVPDSLGAAIPVEAPPLEGIHVFPPLGTHQLLSGIIVPEDFELPPGYVRHFQTTDGGETLPPILMFHPRRPPLDWRGEPLPVTADRVVPPELAPEGMPIVILAAPRSGPPLDDLSRFLDRR